MKIDSSVDSIILRVPILYGPVEYPGESSITQIAEKLLKNQSGSFDNDAIRYPTHTEDVAYAISRIISLIKNGEKLQGIYHCSSEQPYTKYEMALLMGKIFNIPESQINTADPDPNAAPRPQNSHLSTTGLKALDINKETLFKPALEKILFPYINF